MDVTQTKQVKGLRDLVFDAIDATTKLVEDTHLRASRRVGRGLGVLPAVGESAQPVVFAHDVTAKTVYSSVRAVTRGVQCVLRTTLDPMLDLAERQGLMGNVSAQAADRVLHQGQAALNGLYGNHLAARGNALALDMCFRWQGREVELSRQAMQHAYPNATPRIAIFTHGLSRSEHIWTTGAERYYGDADVSFGSRLQQDLGFTPLYVLYNSGHHISENGEALANLIEQLLQVYPCPVEEVILVGHSMGGLVSRSAAHYAREASLGWSQRLKHVVCLGSPHLGAPLEKGVHWLSALLRSFPTAGTEVPAALLNARSAGIKDLRYGYTVHEEWQGRDPDDGHHDERMDIAPVDGVAYYYLAATITRDAAHPAGVILGDVLVRLPSALGCTTDPARRIPFRSGKIFGGMHHFSLVNHPDVYAAMLELLTSETLPKLLPAPPLGAAEPG